MANVNPSQVATINDVFELFESMATMLASKCNFPLALITETREILRHALGEQWILDAVNDNEGVSPIAPFCKHPIGNLFATSGQSQIAELMELAIYLKYLCNVEGLDQVIKNLKSADYKSSFLQLAMAFRLKASGAEELVLEPEAQRGGKADIGFTFKGESFLAECYCPQFKLPSSAEFDFAMNAIVEAFKSFDVVMRLKLTFKKIIIPQERKKIVNEVIVQMTALGAGQKVDFCDDYYSCSIEDISNQADTDPHDFDGFASDDEKPSRMVFSTLVAEKDFGKIRRGEVVDKERRSRLFVWLPDEVQKEFDITQEIDSLTKKVKKKLVQTKIEGKTVGRIVFVKIPKTHLYGLELNEAEIVFKALKKMQEIINGEHDDVATIACVDRKFCADYRYRLFGCYLMGKAESALPPKLYQRLYDIEDKNDILLGMTIPR